MEETVSPRPKYLSVSSSPRASLTPLPSSICSSSISSTLLPILFSWYIYCTMTVVNANRVTTSVDMIVSLVVRLLTTSGLYFTLCFSSRRSLLTSHCTE